MGLEYPWGHRDEEPDPFSAGRRHELYVNRNLRSAKTLSFAFMQAEYQPQPDKNPGEMLRLPHTSSLTCIHVRVYACRDRRQLRSPSFFHPLSPSPILVKEREKLLTPMLSKERYWIHNGWLVAVIRKSTWLMPPELAGTGFHP